MEQIQFHHFTLKKLVAKDEPNLVDLENQAHPGKKILGKKSDPILTKKCILSGSDVASRSYKNVQTLSGVIRHEAKIISVNHAEVTWPKISSDFIQGIKSPSSNFKLLEALESRKRIQINF